MPTHETLETLARAGFDYVVLDAEHAPLTLETVYRLIAHAQALGLAALVRVLDQASNDFQRLLDCGADGLLVPRVRSADEARRAIGRTLFSPRGERGLGITSRAGLWGTVSMDDYVRRGTDNVLRCPQFEDRQVLKTPAPSSTWKASTRPSSAWAICRSPPACRRAIPLAGARRWPAGGLPRARPALRRGRR